MIKAQNVIFTARQKFERNIIRCILLPLWPVAACMPNIEYNILFIVIHFGRFVLFHLLRNHLVRYDNSIYDVIVFRR